MLSGARRESPDKVVCCSIHLVFFPCTLTLHSGHAIWIGNLPSQTNLMSLVHHVCKEAEGLESLFLISKSNCAFANYTDETTCLAAQQKLHESKFQSVRLVSRLRKNTVEGASGVTAPTGPSAIASQPPMSDSKQSTITDSTEIHTSSSETATSPITSPPESKVPVVVDVAAQQKDKFFILKSLTLEDLELSVRTGIWATQSHNEETLNTAFKVMNHRRSVPEGFWLTRQIYSPRRTFISFFQLISLVNISVTLEWCQPSTKTRLLPSSSRRKRKPRPTSISREKSLLSLQSSRPRVGSLTIQHEVQFSGKLLGMTWPMDKRWMTLHPQLPTKTMRAVQLILGLRIRPGESRSSWNGCARPGFLSTDAEVCATLGIRTGRSRLRGMVQSWKLLQVDDSLGSSTAIITALHQEVQ